MASFLSSVRKSTDGILDGFPSAMPDGAPGELVCPERER